MPSLVRRTRIVVGVLVAVTVALGMFAVWPAGVHPTETIPDDEYAALLAALPVRTGEELYTTIPWETSLSAAREKARTERKPMLVWSMDGHPLGCG